MIPSARRRQADSPATACWITLPEGFVCLPIRPPGCQIRPLQSSNEDLVAAVIFVTANIWSVRFCSSRIDAIRSLLRYCVPLPHWSDSLVTSARKTTGVSLAVTSMLLSVLASSQTRPPSLRIVVLEGEGAINNVLQHRAKDPVVRVVDENDGSHRLTEWPYAKRQAHGRP